MGLARVGAQDGAKERLREWLTSPATLDRLGKNERLTNTAGGSLGTFDLCLGIDRLDGDGGIVTAELEEGVPAILGRGVPARARMNASARV